MVTPELLAAVTEALGIDVRLVGPTPRGESRSTFVLSSPTGDLVLKVMADGPGVLDDQRRLLALVADLRSAGYPAAEHLAAARAGRAVFTVQRHLPGETLEPGCGAPVPGDLFGRILPSLLAAVDLQRDRGDLRSLPWPGWLLDTIRHGGNGYCLHETMRRRPDTSALLDRLIGLADRCTTGTAGPVRTTDLVHFDLNPANILHEGGHLTGIVDWNVPFAGAAQGDRGFDVATLLFYSYGLDATRELLWDTATSISGVGWTVVHLCHLTLRAVEWTVRHRPGTPEARRLRDIGTRVLDDCEARIR
jgi:Ser/Thr protein kinase RdoA (MazF antagonist)